MLSTLPVEQEVDLIHGWQQDRRKEALHKLIALYMPRIKAWARKGSQEYRDDLIAEGVMALILAAERIDPQVSGALGPAIRGAILRASAGLSAQISIPERQIRDAMAGRMEPEKAAVLRQALQVIDFDEFAIGLNCPAAEEEALSKEKQRRLRAALAQALRPLARDERHIVVRHLLHGDAGLEELASRLHLSTARARSLEGRALHKMRNSLIKSGFALQDLT